MWSWLLAYMIIISSLAERPKILRFIRMSLGKHIPSGEGLPFMLIFYQGFFFLTKLLCLHQTSRNCWKELFFKNIILNLSSFVLSLMARDSFKELFFTICRIHINLERVMISECFQLISFFSETTE